MKFKRFAAGLVAAVMAFTVLGTPLGDILPFVRESVATTAGAESYGDYTYKCLTMGRLKLQSTKRRQALLIYLIQFMAGK